MMNNVLFLYLAGQHVDNTSGAVFVSVVVTLIAVIGGCAYWKSQVVEGKDMPIAENQHDYRVDRPDYVSFEDKAREKFAKKAQSEAVAVRSSRPKKETEKGSYCLAHVKESEIDDAEFERIIENEFSPELCERAFYTKVVGVKHKNPDGTFRSRIVSECSVTEQLYLHHEVDNAYDVNAIAVYRQGDLQQLGYLSAEVASQVCPDIKRGVFWFAFLRGRNFSPVTGGVVSANIYLLRFTDAVIREIAARSKTELVSG